MNHSSLACIILIPLLGSLVSFAAGFIAPRLSGWIATAAAVASFALVFSLFRALPDGAAFEYQAFNWITVADLKLPFLLRFDALTAIMCLVITGIGSLIHLYSIEYMSEDRGQARFFAYLNLFLFAMLVLVLGASLPIIFIGWEGVGLCSYLLIGFWYTNDEYASAGKKAFIVNRIGDVGFLIGMFLIFANFNSLDIATINGAAATTTIALGSASLIVFSLFIGAIGKSAQIPLFVWLPDAMAGPTPVSALIHAATMVTAGIYLIARLHPVFEMAPEVMVVITLIAALTAIVAAAIALTQNDIKKVLAYSTVSQLGFMFMAAGVGAYWVAIFHLVTHAFFKACLFLAAGSVIHACHHEQDMRKMGGLFSSLRITGITYLIATLAIAGIAPFSGYYSKHAIIESIGTSSNLFFVAYASLIGYVATFTGFLTAFYMMRSFAMTFLGSYRGTQRPHESPWKMTFPLIVLAFFSLVAGAWFETILPEFLVSIFGPSNLVASDGIIVNVLHSWVGISGVIAALLFYTIWKDLPGRCAALLRPLTILSENKFFFDEIYDFLIVRPLQSFSRFLSSAFDIGFVDMLVTMSAKSVDTSGFIASRIQSGQLRSYSLMMFVAALLIITFYIVL